MACVEPIKKVLIMVEVQEQQQDQEEQDPEPMTDDDIEFILENTS